jgi:hypothetical protein
VPSVVLLFAVVGSWEVLQQTPLESTDEPPSEEIFPPLEAAVVVMEVIEEVVIVGATADVVNEISFP